MEYLTLSTSLRRNYDKEQFTRFVEELKKGWLVPQHSYNWLDPIKVYVEENVESILLNGLNLLSLEQDSTLMFQSAQVLLRWDAVNEKGLRFAILALEHQGKHSLASEVFKNFCSEYERFFGEEYRHTFQEMLTRK